MPDDIVSLPGEFSGEVTSALYADKMPLDAVTDALRSNDQLLSGQRLSADRFWSTPRRPVGDMTRDVMEVNLNVARRINAIAFELAHFPQDCDIEFFNSTTGRWSPVLTIGGEPTVVSVRSSIPARLMTAVIQQTHQHPQHTGAGHWTQFNLRIKPVTASRFRFVLTRPDGQPPVDGLGQPVAYSLGIRNVNIGYRVRDRRDIPRRRRVTVTESEDFTTSTDLLGSTVKFALRENKATNILHGGVWKCEPQPVSYAVVNFYVDARDADGNPQVIDRFYMDPLYSGPSVNIYYSNDRPEGEFAGSDEPIPFPIIQAHGAVAPSYSPRGISFADAISYLDIDNKGVQWRVRSSWWMALTISPQFSSADTTTRRILDASLVKIDLLAGSFIVTYNGSSTALDVPFTANQQVVLLVVFDADAKQLRVAAISENTSTMTIPVTIPETPVNSSLRFGGRRVGQGSDPENGFYVLNHFVLKQAQFDAEDFAGFLSDPTSYNTKPEDAYTTLEDDSTRCSLLRMDPSFMTRGINSTNPAGFVGGPGDYFADMEWTPVSRDFKLRKGFYFLAPTQARFFKFEFTDLAAEPYETFAPITRKVKVFTTTTVRDHIRHYASDSSLATSDSGVEASKNLSSYLRYEDDVASTRGTRNTGRDLPTEALYSTDPVTAAQLQSKHYLYGFHRWLPGIGAPRFVHVQKHYYETVEVKHDRRVAYFVGLKSLGMYRVDYTTSDDTDQYVELFYDQNNVAASSWTFRPNDLSTEGSGMAGVSVTSKIFRSRRTVKGVQFATTQTPPIQLLPDPDFNDTENLAARWGSYGAAEAPAPSVDYNSDIGTTVVVRRTTTGNFWGNLEINYPSWNDMSGLTWDNVEGDVAISPEGGIRSLDLMNASAAGRLYAAARVVAPEALSAPLWVQIVNATGTVLSEAPVTVPADQVTEWHTALTISQAGTVTHTWDYTQSTYPTWTSISDGEKWNTLEASVVALAGPVGVRIVQKEPSDDVWYVDTLSLYDDGIVWEFSNDGGATFYPVFDIKNDPNGVFIFPESVSTNVDIGRELVWRVTGYRPDLHVNALTIRPWYGDLLSGVAHREVIQAGGPNLAMYDQYAPVQDDPRFKMWHHPIPQDWFFSYRQWLMTQRSVS